MCCRAEDLTLWYSRPAAEWTEALPVGNSRMGAMVYGGTDKETIQFNEETFWSGSPYNNDSPRALAALPEVRRLIFAGREKEAEKLLDQTFFTGQHGMRFLPAGYLHMDFPGHENATAYRRQLDLATALATTTYTVGGTRYRRTVTAPMGTGVIMMRIEADKPGALAFTAWMDSRLEHEAKAVGTEPVYEMRGRSPGRRAGRPACRLSGPCGDRRQGCLRRRQALGERRHGGNGMAHGGHQLRQLPRHGRRLHGEGAPADGRRHGLWL